MLRRLLLLSLTTTILLPAAAASAQADGCKGALDALNRIKEQIVPSLSAATPEGKRHLTIMSSALENGTHVCKDVPELWFYRMVVSQRLGNQTDAVYAKSKIDDIEYDHHFDPFSQPPSAVPPPHPDPATPAVIRKKWALVVGIDQFQDPNIHPLHFAVKDSRDFVKFLEDPNGGRFDPSRVLHLENEAATLKGIKGALGTLRTEAGPDDLVVLYLSSHGSARDKDPNGMSFIMTNDTDIQDSATIYGSSLQMIDLVQQINREIRSRHVILMLDTCYSGGAIELNQPAEESGSRGITAVLPADPPADAPSSTSFSPSFDNLKVGYGRAVITASRADEPSWESSSIQNGYFTHYLIETLETSHGKEALAQVFPEVRTKVAAHVKAEQHARQNPTYEFSEHAEEIVLGVAEAN
jgi:uncharacterized caspase-like protein